MGSLLRRIILLSLGIGFGLALSTLLSSRADAFEVDQLRAESMVGQPLQLQLRVNDLTDADQLRVRVAGTADYARYGLERPLWADQLQFDLQPDAAGPVLVRIRGDHRPTETLLPLVLEFAWPGRLRLQQLRFQLGAVMPVETAVPAPVEPVRAAAPLTVIPAQTESITVATGDTLLQLAQRWSHSDLTLEQRARLLFDANPRAFIADDPNRLRRGARFYWPEPGQPVPSQEDARRWLAEPSFMADAERTLEAPVATAASASATVRMMVVAEEESGLSDADLMASGRAEDLQQRLQSLRSQRANLLEQSRALEDQARALDQRLRITDERLAALEQQLTVAPDPIEVSFAPVPETVALNLMTPETQPVSSPEPAVPRLSGHTLFAWFMVVVVALFLILMNLFERLRRRPAAASSAVEAASTAPAIVPEPAPSAVQPRAAPVPVEQPVEPVAAVIAPAPRVAPTLGDDEDEYDFMTDAQAQAQQTRLDLAQAYIDMDQKGSARQLLEVVLSQGTTTQREQARCLLEQLS